MTHYIFDGIKNATFFLGADGVLAISVVASVLIFIFGVKLIKKGKRRKSLFSYVCISSAILFFELLCFVSVEFSPVSVCLFYLFITIVLAIVLGFILYHKKAKKIGDVKKEFIKLIDEKIKSEENGINVYKDETVFQAKEEEEKNKTGYIYEDTAKNENKEQLKGTIDYEHVKNVIERVKFFSLSPSDRHTVRELENAVKLAENGYNEDLSEKLNDGLGSLLKIMAKYKV